MARPATYRGGRLTDLLNPPEGFARDFFDCFSGFEGEYLLYLTEKHGNQAEKVP